MKKPMLNFRVYLVLFSLSVLLLLPNSAMAEGDGGWTTAASPGHIFQIEEDLHNNQRHLVMTVLKADGTHEVHWGPASESADSTYLLKSMNGESDMMATWQFNSVTQATVTVESCSTNCLWQSGQVVTLKKFFGDKKVYATIATRVPKTGQAGCWGADGNSIDCAGTGQDGEYQLGVLPIVPPSFDNPFTVNVCVCTGTRFTDNRDGTVTDNLTDLIWLKNANCFGSRFWADALSLCNNLDSGSCGLTDSSRVGDWRLPNFNELFSLLGENRFIAEYYDHPFTSVNGPYWTSTTNDRYRFEAWEVSFYGEGAGSRGKGHYPGGPNDKVWPVRSGN